MTIKTKFLLLPLALFALRSVHAEESSGLKPAWRNQLSDSGFDFNLGYKGEFTSNFTGGAQKQSGVLGNLDVKTHFDFEKSLGLTGFSADLYALGNHGSKPSEFVGDMLGTSNIEAPSTFKLFEAYLTQKIGGNVDISTGFKDLNATFYALDSASLYRNSAFGISPVLAQTGANGPSIFPNAALALVVTTHFENGVYTNYGVFNARAGNPNKPYGTHYTLKADDGYLVIVEGGYAKSGALSTKVALGGWVYTKTQLDLETTGLKRNFGGYLMADQGLATWVAAFVKIGCAQRDINAVNVASEIGFTFKNFSEARADDQFGVALAQTWFGHDSSDHAQTIRAEGVVEATYKFFATSFVAVIPDFQYIVRPSGNTNLKNAVVGSIRLDIEI